MGTFTWLGGPLNQGASWSSGGSTGVEPGSTDGTIFPNGGGTLSGSLTAGVSVFGSGGFVLSGNITDTQVQGFVLSPGASFSITSAGALTAAGEQVSSGATITQHGGTNVLTGSGNSLYLPGAYVLSGGILSGAAAAELVSSGTFKQISGANTIAEVLIGAGGKFTLGGGTLAVVSNTSSGSGDEFVGLGSGGTFLQTGGSHTVAQALTVGYGGSGTFTLSGGTLAVPVSGTSASPTGEYIGENPGGQGAFIQTGGTNSVADRIVIGTYDNGGPGSNTSGTYTLGGSGTLDVQTLFVGSEEGCSGTFNFNSAAGDKASLNISGNSTIFSVGLIVGGDGSGTFVQGGGTLDTSLEVGRHTDGTGGYFLNSGTLKTNSGKNEWVGDAGTGTFIQSGGSNTIGGSLFVASGGSAVGEYNVDSASTLTVAQGIQIGVQTGAKGYLNLDPEGTGGKLTASAAGSSTAMIVGSGGSGTFSEVSGSAQLTGLGTATVLEVGASAGGNGAVRISGGTLTVTAAGSGISAVVIGDAGSGTYLQTGGSATFGGSLIIGASDGGNGDFNFNGSSSTLLKVSGNVTVGAETDAQGTFNYDTSATAGTSAKLTLGSTSILTIGNSGSGTFNQNGGQLSAARLYVGLGTSGSGGVNLSGGTLTVTTKSSDAAVIGGMGSGKFVQSGGTANFTGGFVVGEGGTGNYEFSAGRLTAGSGVGGTAIVGLGVELPSSASGTFTQQGGTGIFNGGLLVGGVAGNGQFTLSGGTDTFSALVTVGMGGTGTFTETGGTATFAKNLTVGINESGDGTFGLTGSGAAIVTGQVTIGADKGVGTFNFNSAGGSASLQGSGSAAPAFEVGVGGTGFLNVYGGAISASDVGIGSGGSGDGRVEITGSSAKLSAATIEIGGFKSGNSVSGGVGDLVVSDGGYVSDAKTLTLQDYATVNSSGNPVFSGTIFIFDGSMEVGGHGGGLASGTLQIDSGGVVVGHGQIEGLSSFNTIVAAGGKLEASAGVLEVDGNVSGRGTIQIDANSKLEITSAVSAGATITFQAGASAGLELDDAEDFAGTLTGFGKTTTQFINLGDVASGATVKLAYTPNSSHPTSSGVLTVSSGGGVVATISMIGAYVTSNFHLGNATDGSVLITDPPVAVQSANAALLGNYVAASFVSAAGGIGGVVLTEPAQTANVQPSLTHPHTG